MIVNASGMTGRVQAEVTTGNQRRWRRRAASDDQDNLPAGPGLAESMLQYLAGKVGLPTAQHLIKTLTPHQLLTLFDRRGAVREYAADTVQYSSPDTRMDAKTHIVTVALASVDLEA
jgi:hypothetical protein